MKIEEEELLVRERAQFTLKNAYQKICPLLMVIGSVLIFCTLTVLSKLMPIPPGQYVSTEAAFNIPFCLLICCHSGIDLSPLSITEKKMWFCGRIIFSGVGYVVKIIIVRKMNIGDATAIIASASIWAGCLARAILKEKYTLVNLFAAIFGVVGVILIAKPGALFTEIYHRGESSVPWAFATFGASLMLAFSFLCARGVGEAIHPMKIVLYTAIVEFLSGFVIDLSINRSPVIPPCDWVRGASLACGIGATVANLLIVRGLSLENSGPATLMINTETMFAYIFQVTLFNTAPDWLSLLGAGIIVCAVLLQGIDRIFDISCGITF